MRGLTFRLLLALCLLASTAQGFVAQTHVHAAPRAAAARDAAADALVAVDPACVLCDIAGHSPAAAPLVHVPGLVLPASAPAASALPALEAFTTTASHHWRGRAPPFV